MNEKVPDPALALVRRLGTERMPHAAGRSLFDHLTGMARIAVAWRLPSRLRDAALMHSVYGTAVYRRAALGVDRRREVRDAVGADAERLAYLFGGLDRSAFVSELATMDEPRGRTLALRSGDREELAADEVRDLVVLGIINEVEQTCAPDRSPASWRVRCRPLVAALVRWGSPGIPELIGRTFPLAEDAEAAAIAAYAEGVALVRRDPEAARGRFEAVARAGLGVGEPIAWLAFLAAPGERPGNVAAAAAAARAGFATWGTAWDKRLTLDAWLGALETLAAGGGPAALESFLD
jgi:hypothetical protein